MLYSNCLSAGTWYWNATVAEPTGAHTLTIYGESGSDECTFYAAGGYGTINGHVYDCIFNDPIPNAHVTLKQNGTTVRDTWTDQQGSYTLTEVPPDSYMICARDEYDGYSSESCGEVTVQAGETVTRDFWLWCV